MRKPKPNNPNARGRRPFSWARWLDDCKLAAAGILLAFKKPKFVLVFLLTLILFGTLMNLLTNGLSQFLLLFQLDWSGKWLTLSSAFLATFGVGRAFLDWLFVFCIAFLQALLVGLIVLIWHQRTRARKAADATPEAKAAAEPETAANVATRNSDNLQTASLTAGLALLASGCPTCGTSLLVPLLASFTSASSALAGALSGVLYAFAIILALWSLRRIGGEVYAIIISEKRGKNE